MADTNEPLSKLEPNGRASVINYNVPEPTSYPGRNYIDLQIDAGWFKQSLRPAPAANPIAIIRTEGPLKSSPNTEDALAAAAGASEAPVFHLVTPSEVLRLGDGSASPPERGNSALIKSDVAGLDAKMLETLSLAGKEPAFYRSLYGTLSVRIANKSTLRDEDGSMPTDPELPPYLVLNITSPRNGDTIGGPATGVTVPVTGTAEVVIEGESYSVQEVAIQVGLAAFQPATFSSGNNWLSWSGSGKASTPGPVKVTVRATHTVGARVLTRTKTVTVTIAFAETQPGDTTPPMLTISSPTNGGVVPGTPPSSTGHLLVTVKGTAADAHSGVQSVKVIADGDEAMAADAQPKAAGDWSEWMAPLSLPAGPHAVTAKCADKAGNVAATMVAFTASAEPVVVPKVARLLLVESYRLSTYLGNYGAGRTVKTFTLLPGEKTRISVKTYTRRETDRKDASSILDSFTQESATDFENSTTAEQSYKENYDESFKYSVRGEAQGSWGWGSAKLSAEASGGTNAAREEFAKNVVNATQKHAARASAKRDVQINTSYEVKEQTGEETSIERELENINVSRTLNFVFRQMNQEFFTFLHLVDVRVAFFRVDIVNGEPVPTYREATLPQLKSFLAEVIVPDQEQEVRQGILHQVRNIFDYRDEPHSFYEEKELADGSKYLRIKRDLTSTYKDPATQSEFVVPGIILAATKNVMRTEGVVVEALLGQGDALDAYSHGLQDEAVKAKQLANTQTEAEIEKSRLAKKLVDAKDSAAAKVFEQVYPCCPPDGFKLVLSKEQGEASGRSDKKL